MSEKEKIKHKPGEYLMSDQSTATSYYKRKDTTWRWPDKFKQEYCEDIVEFMSKGKSLSQWATSKKIDPVTLRKYMQKYPEFAKAKDRAVQANMAYWESVGELGTVGKIPNFKDSTYKFLMKNRFPNVYKDVHHTEQTTTVRFETFVNEAGQIEHKKEDVQDADVISETEGPDKPQLPDKKEE